MQSEEQPQELAYVVVPSRVEEVVRVRRMVGALSRRSGFAESDVMSIEVAVGEALANAVRHGSPRGEEDTVEIVCRNVDGHYMEVIISDRGTGFDLPQWLSEIKPLSLSEGQRGILLIVALMDEVDYARTEAGGRLLMRKYPSGETASDNHEHGTGAARVPAIPQGAAHGASRGEQHAMRIY